MPFIHRRRRWQPAELNETPEDHVIAWSQIDRRESLKALLAGGVAMAGAGLWGGLSEPSALADEKRKEPAKPGQKKKELGSQFFPAKRNSQFQLDRPITDEVAAGRYNNFYEFSTGKRVAGLVKGWELGDWKLELTGLVERPASFAMDDLGDAFPYEERLYRHRCVEAWSMAVPWTGFPLRKLLDYVKPLASAKFVKFVSFDHTKAKGIRRTSRLEPWPYTEALSITEAANELTLIVTGMYGHPLLKQHGAPVRLVVPWKYGFKSAKSLVRIEFVATRPATFWNTMIPSEYDAVANVDPTAPHPRWSQAMEWDIGTKVRRPTQPFNGYGEWVAELY